MFIDSHAHIYDERLKDRFNEIIENLNNNFLDYIVVPSCDYESMKQAFEVSQKYDKIYCALGMHPENSKDFDDEIMQFQLENAKNAKVVAIGEIGLDYFYEFSKRTIQKKVLEQQLEYAKSINLPYIFHVRDAYDDFFSIIKNYKIKAGVMHCFGGDKEIAKKALDLGLHISFTCNLGYKNSINLREAGEYTPLDRIMIETDCPYMSPKNARKEINTPMNVQYVAEELSYLKKMPIEKIAQITKENSLNFFDKIIVTK